MSQELMIQKLEEELKDLRADFAAYKLEQQREEGRRLKAALVAAGGVILALVGFLWWEVIWPILESERNR